MKNLNTTGTFKDYIGSIHAEIVRLLGIPPEGERYWVETKDDEWINGQTKERMPLKDITISDGTTFTSFSIAETEFEQNQRSKKCLENLANVRLQNAVGNLKDLIEGPNRMIEKLTALELEPEVFSDMSFEEIQIAAGKMLSGHEDNSRIDKSLVLIVNLAARMREKFTASEPEPEKMTHREITDCLNAIANEINEAVGETVIGEFLTDHRQLFVLQSHIGVTTKINIMREEVMGCHVKEVIIERALMAYDEIIRLSKEDKAKLEALV